MSAVTVLFACIENSSRSQMAEAFARRAGHPDITVASAGSRPSGVVNPRVIDCMRERGYDLSAHASKGLDEFADSTWDYLITMGCGDECPNIRALHREDWTIPDPRSLSDRELSAVRGEIEERVQDLVNRIRRGQ